MSWLILAVCGWASPSFAQQPPETVLSRSTEAGKAGKPWLVVFLFDKSGSMNNPCAEDPTGQGRPNWDVVIEDARRKLEQLPSELGSFDLCLYTFGTEAALYEQPVEGRAFTVNGPDEARAIASDEIRRMSRPLTGQGTNLWKSLENLNRGLDGARISDRYGGVLLVIFSDGQDGLANDGPGGESARRYRSMTASLESLRSKGINIQVSLLPIGEWKQYPDRLKQLGTIEVAALGKAILPPLKVSFGLSPDRIRIAPMPEGGATGDFRLKLDGFPSPPPAGAIQVEPAGGSGGLVVEGLAWSGGVGTVRLRSARGLAEGGSIPLNVRVDDGSGAAVTLPLTVVVPSFRKVAPVVSWGLPPTCDEFPGRARIMLLRKGDPLEVTLSVPSEATVRWTIDGADAGTGPTLSRPDLEVGRHVVTASVSTPDQTVKGEFLAFVLDTNLEIKGARSVRAGDPLALELQAASSIAPELANRLGPVDWIVAGAKRPETDGSIKVTFNRRGSERIAARRSLEICGTSIDFTASEIIEVRPGPAIRLFGGELVRGQENRVEAELSAADEISRVLFKVDGTPREAVIQRGVGDQPTLAWIPVRPGETAEVVIEAIPILKDDRGIDRSPTDPECGNRAQTRTYRITDPDVSISFGKPSEGEQKSFGAPFEVQVAPSGRDSAQAVRIELGLKPADGPASSLTLTGDSGWKGSITPSVGMGHSLSLRAQAFGKEGPLGPAATVTVSLAAARPALTAEPDHGTVSWGGRNENPKPATVRIVVQGSTSAMARGEIASVEWRCLDDGLRLASTIDGDTGATFDIIRAGVHTVEARVRTADGQTYILRKDITARPVEVVADPALPDREFPSTRAIEIDHSATRGAWTDVKLRVRRAGRDWAPVQAGTALEPPPVADENIAFEAWYRPWGVADSVTPWEAGSGWILGGPVEGIARVPRNWFWPAVAGLVAIVLCGLIIKQSMGHEHVRARVWWCRDSLDDEENRFTSPSGWIGAHPKLPYSFWTRTASIELPNDGGGEHNTRFGWLEKLPRRGRSSVPRVVLYPGNDYDFLLADGTSQRQRAARPDSDFCYLKVQPPEILARDPDWGTYEPIYLHVNHKDPKHREHVLLVHQILFRWGLCLLIAGATLWLVLTRTI